MAVEKRAKLTAAVMLIATLGLSFSSSSLAQRTPGDWGFDDDAVFLPDLRPLPELPVRLKGEWLGAAPRAIPWDVELAIDGDRFEGKVTFREYALLLPLTVQGIRKGDIVEFSVRFNKGEVAHFAGHLAGTSLVGTLEQPDGSVRNWEAGWFPETLEMNEEPGP